MWKSSISILTSLVILSSCLTARAQQPGSDASTDMIAAQVRLQGFACDKALKATRDSKRSRPDRSVWVLKCSNAMYRFTRAPDMAAQIKQLR